MPTKKISAFTEQTTAPDLNSVIPMSKLTGSVYSTVKAKLSNFFAWNISTDIVTDGGSNAKSAGVKAIKDYTDGLVVGLLDDRGNYDPTITSAYPATGGSGTAGAILKGDLWFISVSGTIAGIAVNAGCSIRALADTPGQTAGNWDILDNQKENLTDLGDVAITTPSTDQVLKYNGVEWVNGNSGATSASIGIEFFPDDTAIIPAGNDSTYPIKTLSKVPITTAEDVDSITMNGNTALYGTYAYDTAMGRTVIDAGVWTFNIYAGVSSSTNTTSLSQNINRARPLTGTLTTTGTGTTRTATASAGTPFAVANIDVGGTIDSDSFLRTTTGYFRILSMVSDTEITIETPSTYTNEVGVAASVHKRLFQITTGEINNTATSPLFAGLQLYSINSAQPAFTVEVTDKLATAFFGVSNGNRTVYFAHNGTTRYSHFQTPLITMHNNLAGLNGGTGAGVSGEFFHLTSAQHTVATQAASSSVNGFMIAADKTKLDDYPAVPAETNNQLLSDTGEWVDVPIPAGGFANNLYLSADDVLSPVTSPTTKLLSYTPDVAATELATDVIVGDGDKLVRSFLYPSGVAISSYPSGLWTFNLYSKVSAAAGITQIGVRYFKYATDTTKTYVFSSIIWSSEINNTVNEFVNITTVQPSFAVDPTDRMGVDVYIKTTASATRTVTITLGDGYASHMNTPNAIRHSQLRDKNGEADVQHLTAAQVLAIAEFTGTFTSADSTGFAWTDNNTLAVTHNLGKQYVDVLIYDNNGVKVDYTITATSTSVATISFPIAAVPITGTWNIRIR